MIYKKSAVVATVFMLLLSQMQVEAAKNKTSKAKKNNTNYTQKQTNKAISLLNTARKLVEKGKMQDAINSYWKVLEIDPAQAYAYLELGELYKNLRIYDRSTEMLTTGLDLADDLDNNTVCNYYCILVEVYVTTNQQGLANKALIKAAEAAPRNPMPRKILGDIYLNNNRIANAFKAYKKSLELDPYYQPAIDALANLKLEYGDKLPKEDKDSDYIKKVAVKLEPPKSQQTNNPKTDLESSKPEITDTTLPANNNTADKTNNTLNNKPHSNINQNDRPMPLSQSEMAKINSKKSSSKPAKKVISIIEEHADTSRNEVSELNEDNVNQTIPQENIEEAIDENLDRLLEGNAQEKEEAIAFFTKCGKQGLSAIEDLIYDRNPEVRILAAQTLPRFTDFPEEVKTILEDASDDSDEDVAEAIRQALETL